MEGNSKGTNINCIVITGPSASGKSTLAKHIASIVGRNRCLVICQDDYYKDWSRLPFRERSKINFDHPGSFDFRLLQKHLRALKKGRKIKKPIYSFKKHMRLTKRYTLSAKRYIIIEGLMPLLNNELRRLSDCKWVAIHDGARPLVTNRLITDGLKAAQHSGAAVPAIPVKDTIKDADKGAFIQKTLPRERLWAAQTPQIFRFDIINEAYAKISSDVTDDASMVEALGYKVKIFPGSTTNIKVTTPEDLIIAEAILSNNILS